MKALEKDKGYCLEQRASAAGQSFEKGNDKGYCLEQRQAMPVKALEKAMTELLA